MKPLFHKVVSAEALPDYVLGVRFAGGEEKRYDMKPVFAGWPMFEGLRKSPELFGEVAVGPGGYGVVWGDEWDVGADELFANGEKLEETYAEARRGRDAEGEGKMAHAEARCARRTSIKGQKGRGTISRRSAKARCSTGTNRKV